MNTHTAKIAALILILIAALPSFDFAAEIDTCVQTFDMAASLPMPTCQEPGSWLQVVMRFFGIRLAA